MHKRNSHSSHLLLSVLHYSSLHGHPCCRIQTVQQQHCSTRLYCLVGVSHGARQLVLQPLEPADRQGVKYHWKASLDHFIGSCPSDMADPQHRILRCDDIQS